MTNLISKGYIPFKADVEYHNCESEDSNSDEQITPHEIKACLDRMDSLFTQIKTNSKKSDEQEKSFIGKKIEGQTTTDRHEKISRVQDISKKTLSREMEFDKSIVNGNYWLDLKPKMEYGCADHNFFNSIATDDPESIRRKPKSDTTFRLTPEKNFINTVNSLDPMQKFLSTDIISTYNPK